MLKAHSLNIHKTKLLKDCTKARIVERIAESGHWENEFRKFKEFCQMISPGGFRIAEETPLKQECIFK